VSTKDVVVIGGGVIGLSIAWKAADAGLSTALIDKRPGRGASWAAAGLLAPITEVHHGEERVLQLGIDSLRRYPRFVAELEELTGLSVGYRTSGTLIVASDGDAFTTLSELRRLQDDLGLEVQQLTRREARSLEPALTPNLRGAWLVSGDHSVDNRALATALLAACKLRSVELIDSRAKGVVARDLGGRGVQLESGDVISCDQIVIAAGCWSAAIEGIPEELRPPVRPVKGQLLYLRGPVEPRLVDHAIRGLNVYVVPRGDGRIVVGATVEEQGFDTTVTAGGIYQLLRESFELIPGLSELELHECVAGLRPGSPDNAPMIGPTGLDGVLVATGHYRNGILLTPITAEAMAELLATGRVPEAIAVASPQRFLQPQEVSP
jgi:glycine oxidase